ncbi:DMT family transporter [Desulfobotulus sp. H1]|uniref:DMT family transporter n=1 Tax=Desulfobotulus pelophilus TaxID=2823377 RepID=A0ABT3NBC8_9BACT|nr:EamA family transporter [Desulfobotulus pelophilus]MCW7754775.1 DMT family transporter [Desulfobotulus pelophilus]
MPNPSSTSARGFSAVILAALLWASSGSLAKYLFNGGLSPFDLVQVRLTVASVCIGLFLFFRAPEKLQIPLQRLPNYLFLGIFGMAAMQASYLLAISRIQVAAAILLQYLAPVLITIWQLVFQKKPLSLRILMALCTAVAGCSLVLNLPSMEFQSMNITGILAGLGAALTFAIYSLAGEARMKEKSPETVVFFAMTIAAVLWHILLPPFSGFRALGNDPTTWAIALTISTFGTALPFFLFLYGIALTGAAPASITGTLEPVFAGIISFFLLAELFNTLQLCGAALVIAAVILLQLPQTRKNSYHAQNPTS